MKKQLIVFLISLFVVISIINSDLLFAQEPTNTSNQKLATVGATVNYNLAYPGILPDHPIYKLKVLRDRIRAALLSDPRKKIEFYLLQTDKGILATAMLVDKKKYDLATQTALKAEHNYTLLTQGLYNLPRKPDDNFFNKFKDASLKHQEVLTSLIKRVPEKHKKTFEIVKEFSIRNWESVEEYKRQKYNFK